MTFSNSIFGSSSLDTQDGQTDRQTDGERKKEIVFVVVFFSRVFKSAFLVCVKQRAVQKDYAKNATCDVAFFGKKKTKKRNVKKKKKLYDLKP